MSTQGLKVRTYKHDGYGSEWYWMQSCKTHHAFFKSCHMQKSYQARSCRIHFVDIQIHHGFADHCMLKRSTSHIRNIRCNAHHNVMQTCYMLKCPTVVNRPGESPKARTPTRIATRTHPIPETVDMCGAPKRYEDPTVTTTVTRIATPTRLIPATLHKKGPSHPFAKEDRVTHLPTKDRATPL